MSTSLQHIILSTQKTHLEQNIKDLFRPKPYPLFELQQFYRHPLFNQHDHFRFFIDILDQWNRKIEKQEIHNQSNTLFRKNIFIFNTLRNAVIHGHPTSNQILNKLYQWFNETRSNNLRLIEKKHKQNINVDDDWEIRNTFKSNLPAEIGQYRRRIFWNYEPFGKEKQGQFISEEQIYPKNRKLKTEAECNDGDKNEVEEKRLIKIENQLIRSQRQRRELLSVQQKWRMKKSREQEQIVKNYYKANFSANKTYFNRKSPRNNDMVVNTKMIAQKRVQTSMGFRSKNLSYRNRYSQNDAEAVIKTMKVGEKKSWLDEFDSNQQTDTGFKLLANIDGLKLPNNPFQKKIKKRKRKN